MRILRALGVLGLTTALFGGLNTNAQKNSHTKAPGQSPRAFVNRQAVLSRSGDVQATTELAHELSKAIAMPTELGDALGFTNRVVTAEVNFRNGSHQAVHETDIVNAVNNLATTVGTPQWTHTNLAEVKKLRMHMLVLYPEMIASRERPDSKGHYKAVSDAMGPMEASYIATMLIYQKAYNPDYQFTDAERLQNVHLSADSVTTEHLQRQRTIQNLFRGNSQSVSALNGFQAADHFYTDLGIASVSNMSALGHNYYLSTKGGQ